MSDANSAYTVNAFDTSGRKPHWVCPQPCSSPLRAWQACCRGAGDREPYHFLSRYFAPWIGVGEDAVTGSAHTALGPYWASQLSMIGQAMTARQCSRRGGDLQVTVNAGSDKVVIASHAVIVSRGELFLPI